MTAHHWGVLHTNERSTNGYVIVSLPQKDEKVYIEAPDVVEDYEYNVSNLLYPGLPDFCFAMTSKPERILLHLL